MSIRIAIASYGTFSEFIHQVKPFYSDEVEFVIINKLFEDLQDEIYRLEKERSVDVFVGSGGNGRHVAKYAKEIPFVQVRVTGFDFLLALKKASMFSNRVAVITYQERIAFASSIRDVLTMQVQEETYTEFRELDILLKRLYNSGIEDVIGTAYVLERAELLGMRGHYIWSVDGVKSAIDTAVQVAMGKKQDAQRAQKLTSILQTVREGIIVTDSNGLVDEFNLRAEHILGIRREDVLGKPVEDVLPNTRLHVVLERRREEYNRIQEIGQVKVLTNRCPIFSEGNLIGALATFQGVEDVSEAEGTIRQKLYNKGFTAKTCFGDLTGKSEAFEHTLMMARRYAKSSATILIQGESGTGKELFAQSIHNESDRKGKPFVAINCAAMPTSLLESELFGYEGGAFTGAKREGKRGVFELAHEGSIFLDEIGEISVDLQSRLLRVIEQREVFRLGGERMVYVDVRVIAATNKDLWNMVQRGDFREDLYYRLNVLAIALPPLRERRHDIPALCREILRGFCPGLPARRLEEIVENRRFVEYDWPGNIRELKNVMERLAVLYEEGCDPDELTREVLTARRRDEAAPSHPQDREREENARLRAAIESCGGNKTRAAKMLGIGRATLWRKLEKYKIS